MPSTLRSLSTITAACCATIAFSVNAQQPAVAATSDPAPTMNCPTPGEPPHDRTGPEYTRFQKRMDAYKTCVQDYAQANGTKGNALAAQARVYIDAANKAIEDYNTYVTSNKLDKTLD